jgi:ABC-type uncharacterized transport system substrate-binding protein
MKGPRMTNEVMSHIKPGRLIVALIIVAGLVVAGKLVQAFLGHYGSLPATASAEAWVPPSGPIHPDRTYRVLHVMSYHQPWEWTDGQFAGFKEALRDLPIEYKVVQLDAKRNSDPAAIRTVAEEAIREIGRWKPDLVFTGDDIAQQYVTVPCLGSSTPFVFCAVNAGPEDYGFDKALNVTGVLERMHFARTIRLLKDLVPTVRRIALITDRGAMWVPIIEQLKREEDGLEGVQVVSYDTLDTFEEYQQTVRNCQDRVDALGFLGVFEFKGADGRNVLLEDVMKWTVENSRLPDFAFWKDRVDKGTLCAVTVSGMAQGRAAGQIARGILVEGRQPCDYPMAPTETGLPTINLARAHRLGINPNSTILLTADVVKEIH